MAGSALIRGRGRQACETMAAAAAGVIVLALQMVQHGAGLEHSNRCETHCQGKYRTSTTGGTLLFRGISRHFWLYDSWECPSRRQNGSSQRRKKFGGVLVHEKWKLQDVDHPVISFVLRVVAFCLLLAPNTSTFIVPSPNVKTVPVCATSQTAKPRDKTRELGPM